MKKQPYLLKACLSYIKRDTKFYTWILIAFLLGGCIAAGLAFTLPELSCKELLLYLGDFFRNIEQNGADSSALFITGILENLKNFGFLFFCSLTVIGAPLIAIFSAVKGFMHGFTLCFLFRLYGIRAALFFLLGMLPHYMILIPCYGLLCGRCLKFSAFLLREKQELKRSLPTFLAGLIFLFLPATMASLLQAYIEPLLIRLISGLYLV